MDESGFTGYDLLNVHQPFQGAAAVQIDEEVAVALIQKYFPKTKLAELKHQILSRRHSNWKPLLDIQEAVLRDFPIYTYICDKRFLLILTFLDYCVDPAYYEQGIDFYEDGRNYALASLIYYAAPHFWGKDSFRDVLNLFQVALRSKSDVAIEALIQKAISLRGRKLSEYLLPLGARNAACIWEIKTSPLDTDVAYIVILSLISHIEKFVDEPYEVVHDRADNLRRYERILSQLPGATCTKSFRQTSITTLRFPLRMSAVSQVDSQDSRGVQIADLLVGGVIEHFRAMVGAIKKTEYNQSIPDLYGETNFIHLLPNLNFVETKEFRRGTQAGEFIDFVAKNFR